MARTSIFEGNLRKFSRKMNIEFSKVVRKVAFDVWNDVTRETPVDTGRARASWNVSEEYANLAVKPEGYNNPNGQGEVGAISGKKDVIISNNVDYIVFLEEGSSQRAPNGMTKIALANAAANIRTIKI